MMEMIPPEEGGPPYLQALDSEEFIPPASIPGDNLAEEVQELLDDEG